MVLHGIDNILMDTNNGSDLCRNIIDKINTFISFFFIVLSIHMQHLSLIFQMHNFYNFICNISLAAHLDHTYRCFLLPKYGLFIIKRKSIF